MSARDASARSARTGSSATRQWSGAHEGRPGVYGCGIRREQARQSVSALWPMDPREVAGGGEIRGGMEQGTGLLRQGPKRGKAAPRGGRRRPPAGVVFFFLPVHMERE